VDTTVGKRVWSIRKGDKMNGLLILKVFLIIFGILIGSFVPLAFGYFWIFFAKRGFSGKTLLVALVRMLLIPIIFILLLSFVGLVTKLGGLDTSQANFEEGTFFIWFGISWVLGFLGGVITLLIGIIEGIKSIRLKHKEMNLAN
jgi:hypothetical protein